MKETTFDLIIPVRNEEEVIVPTLRLIQSSLSTIPDLKWKIIVVVNNTTDSTAERIASAGLPMVEVIFSEGIGKGAAVLDGLRSSDAEFVGFTDADASPHPNTIGSMLALLKNGSADIVIGSRFHPETVIDRTLFRQATSWTFNHLARVIVGVRVNDTQCPLKIMNTPGKDVLASCTDRGWFFDLEFIAKAECAKLGIMTHPVVWTEFRYPDRKSKLHVGRDGMRAIIAMLQLRTRLREQSDH